MERLTKRDIDGCLIHPWSFNGINGSYDIWDEDLLEKYIDRLAAYEGTGLDPDEIIGLKNTCEQLSGINDSLFKANQEMGKDLAEWKKASVLLRNGASEQNLTEFVCGPTARSRRRSPTNE